MDLDLLKNILNSKKEIKPSPDGRFKDCWYWTGNKDKDGYGRIWHKDKNYRITRISAMLWLNFDIYSNLLICHECDNPECFNPQHLFPGTNKDNMKDMVEKNRRTVKIGEDNLSSKLTESQVIEIRRLKKEDNKTIKEIAAIFSISHQHINEIVYGRYWKHLGNEKKRRNFVSKLSDEQILDAIILEDEGMSHENIGLKLGVSRMTITRLIKSGKWKSVEVENA